MNPAMQPLQVINSFNHRSYGENIVIPVPSQNEENPAASESIFNERNIRRAFIRRVYLILMAQLTVTLAVVSVFTFYPPMEKLVKMEWFSSALVCLANGYIFLASYVVLYCCKNARRKFPLNFILMGLFTMSISLLLGIMAAMLSAMLVVLAVGATAAIAISLTFLALQTKFDFTARNGFVATVSSTVSFFSIMTMFSDSKSLDLCLSCLIAVGYGIFLMYDTQLIVGGKHQYAFNPKEYVFAAMILYVDIIIIFMTILDTLGAATRRENDINSSINSSIE